MEYVKPNAHLTLKFKRNKGSIKVSELTFTLEKLKMHFLNVTRVVLMFGKSLMSCLVTLEFLWLMPTDLHHSLM